jgi:hypothetical protein
MVFFMLNQCRILYFTKNIGRNSVHETGCIGVEEILKKRPNIWPEIFPNRGGDLSYRL